MVPIIATLNSYVNKSKKKLFRTTVRLNYCKDNKNNFICKRFRVFFSKKQKKIASYRTLFIHIEVVYFLHY